MRMMRSAGLCEDKSKASVKKVEGKKGVSVKEARAVMRYVWEYVGVQAGVES